MLKCLIRMHYIFSSATIFLVRHLLRSHPILRLISIKDLFELFMLIMESLYLFNVLPVHRFFSPSLMIFILFMLLKLLHIQTVLKFNEGLLDFWAISLVYQILLILRESRLFHFSMVWLLCPSQFIVTNRIRYKVSLAHFWDLTTPMVVLRYRVCFV